jgi:predicted Zn-dependent protease with MMP-like domain
MNPDFWIKKAEEEIADTLLLLPEPVRVAARECPVQLLVEPDPAQSDDEEAWELLGLFEGCSRLESLPTEPDQLPRISLFLRALLEETQGHEKRFRREVRITYLHELGHYLGWDEKQVEALGL